MIRRITWMLLLTAIAALLASGAIYVLFNHGPMPFIIGGPILYFIFRENAAGSNVLGSARFASYVDLVLSGLLSNRDGVVLGRIDRLPPPTLKQRIVALYNMPVSRSRDAMSIFNMDRLKRQTLRLPERLGMHVAYVAPTGQGKSAGFAIPNLLTDPNPVIVLDFKGEILRETAYARMHKFNQDVAVFAPFGLPQKPEKFDFPTVTFNPLQLIDPTSPLYLDYAAAIAKSLIVRSENEHTRFFSDAAEMVLTSLLALLITEATAEECTLGELRNITALPHKLEEHMDFMMHHAESHPQQMEQLAGPLMSLQGETGLSVISTINSQLRWLDSIAVAQSMAHTSFRPGQLFDRQRGLSLYVHLPVELIRSNSGLTRVIFTSLIHYIFQQGESRDRRIRFYLDEAHGLGSDLDSLYSALVYGRSYGIQLNFFFQALSQIQQVFNGSRSNDLLANVVPVFTGIREIETAKQVSAWIGRQTIEAGNRQDGFNSSVSESFQDRGGRSTSKSFGINSSRSYQQQSRELLQPEEIIGLPEKTCIVTVPHLPPILARPPFYFLDRKLNRLAKKSRRLVLSNAERKTSWFGRWLKGDKR